MAVSLALLLLTTIAAAQAPQGKPVPRPAARPAGTLAQVIFDVQHTDPSAPKKKSGNAGASATETYGNTYSGWDTVENAAVALTDGVDLILKPGRLCQNGKPVPLQQADYQKFAREMRAAGVAVLQAARTKSQEKGSDATNTFACSNCHEVYRDKGPADSPARCTPPPKP